MNISFKSIETKDIPLLYRWLQNPAIFEWYNDGKKLTIEEYVEKISKKIDSHVQFPYLIYGDSLPVGYIQCYDCYGADKEYRDGIVENGTWGIDMFIGEDDYRGKGYGSLILTSFVEDIVVEIHKAKKIMIDPDIGNIAAIKAYQKAGFIVDKEIETDGKKQLIMYYLKK